MINPQQQTPQSGGMAAFMGAQGGGMPQAPSPQQGGQQMAMNMPQIPSDMPSGISPQIQQLIQQLMQMGRGGDTTIAHLTPGEKTVPPEVQTPKVLATLDKAYKDKGVDPQQFTVGSPQSSVNPQSGLPEYNFMAAFLPAALGIAGSIAAPYLAPAFLGAQAAGAGAAGLTAAQLAAASSIGGGVGTTVGGLAAGQKPTQALLAGAGSGLGSYALGGGLSAASGAADAAKQQALQNAILSSKDPAASMAVASQQGWLNAGQSANPAISALDASLKTPTSIGLPATGQTQNSFANLWGNAPKGWSPGGAIGGALGGYIGSQLGAPGKSNPPAYPPGFNTPMHPVNSMGNYQQLLGQPASTATSPNFTNYNPFTNSPGAYNFYPQS